MKRSKTSKQWMREHVNDPFVQRAQKEGYRSRAAYKLLEIAERDHLLKPGTVVVDPDPRRIDVIYRAKPSEGVDPADARPCSPEIGRVEWFRREELPAGTSMAAWALAWCLKDPAITCVIPGCKDPDQVRSNASAADLEMVPA